MPVVATPLPTVRALIDEEGGGVLVPFGDTDATVTAVRDLLADDARRDRLADEGRAAAGRRTWEVEAGRLVTTLRTWAR